MTKKYEEPHSGSSASSDHDGQSGPTISRRGFLITGVSLATVAALPALPPARADGFRYRDNKVRRSRDGLLDTELRVERVINEIPQWEVVTRTIREKSLSFRRLVGTFKVDTRTYEGTIPGPELHVRRGDVLRIKLINEIPEGSPPTGLPLVDVNIPHKFNATNLHTHGFNVPPTCDPPLEELEDDELPEVCSDNVLFEVDPDREVQYEYEIPEDHPDGTFWYHPHKHGSVAFQMMGGMGGAIIIKGPTDYFLRDRGVRKDKTFVIQQIRVKEDGTVQVGNFLDFIEPPWYTVNGKLNPVIHIPPGQVERWRFINAGMSEHVPLQLLNENGDPQPLYQIAADGITFPKPVESELVFPGFFPPPPDPEFPSRPPPVDEPPSIAPGIFMAAGNRADVLIRCDEPGVYQLIKPRYDQGFLDGPVPQVPNDPNEPPPAPIPGQEFPIATVVCRGRPKRNQHLPDDLRSLSLPTPSLPNLAKIPDKYFVGRRRILVFGVDPTSFGLPFPKFQIGGRYTIDEDGSVLPSEPVPPVLPKLPENLADLDDFLGQLFGYLQESHMTPLQFSPDRIDQVIKEEAVEEWTIVNLSNIDHPFHIHQVPFLVTNIFDPRLAPDGEDQESISNTLPRWQDTQNIPGGGNWQFNEVIFPGDPRFIPGIITFRIRFEGGVFRDRMQSIAGRFVLHCHILDHEDTGMMQLVELVP